ncbi:MAG: hypothetical protein JXR87_04175 [Candidatus Marinimicrobia bacterium]|nr:hypothetical protein [Candidatus Neomarinimicrobiota bacterium]
MKKQIILVFVLIFTSILFADTFVGKMIWRVNGHDHFMPDIIGEYFYNVYQEQRVNMTDQYVSI